MEPWQSELAARIRSPRGLAEALGHPAWEGMLADGLGMPGAVSGKAPGLPFAVTRSFLGLAMSGGSGSQLESVLTDGKTKTDGPLSTGDVEAFLVRAMRDPVWRQILPSPEEAQSRACDADDPLGEGRHSPFPRVVHQYPSRLLLRAASDCPVFCRHCFRRSILPTERGFLSESMVESVGAYMQGHPGIREVLVSGGDPLTATDTKLEWLFAALRSARPGILIRLCTRAPVTLPSRVTPGLLGLVRRFRPLVVVVQVNHPKELAGEGGQALGALADVGIGVRSQTVLLRGVNDEAQALEELFVGLTRLGVMPYYLFQADLARGTGHFRVPLSRGLELYASLRRRCSGLELPRYAVDAPGGGGKVHLPEGIVGRSGDGWMLAAPDGSRAVYPEETDGDGT